MKNIELNQLKGLCAAFKDSWGANTKLSAVKASEFETGGYASEIVKRVGYIESGRAVVNNNNWWNLTVADFCEQIVFQAENNED